MNIPITRIQPQESAALEHLADIIDEHLAVRAVIRGAAPGEIFVDNARRPRSALIQAHHRFHLTGDCDNMDFNQALRELFAEEIYPQSLAQGKEVFGLYFSEGWELPIREVILQGRDPIPGQRQVYEIRLKDTLPDWLTAVPSELSMVPVDRALIEDVRLDNLEDLLEELQSERESADEFLEKSFGLCLRSEREIVTWCLSEYNVGTRCEVGIATHPDYRRRGLAAATGTAFLELARQKGMQRVGWHCWADNLGSVNTALRLGFQKIRDYPSYLAFFNPTFNLAVNGNICLDHKDYQAANAWLERALADPDAPAWVYIAAGCAAARLDDSGRALTLLRQAVERGYCNRGNLEQNPHLQSLHDLPEWHALLDGLG